MKILNTFLKLNFWNVLIYKIKLIFKINLRIMIFFKLNVFLKLIFRMSLSYCKNNFYKLK